MLKHFRWETAEGSGRIAVRIDSGVRLEKSQTLELRQLAGQAPPPGIIPALLCNLNLRKQAVRLHHGRENPFFTTTRHGMSGCMDVMLRVQRDAEWGDAPIVARLHVSMADKLNEGFGPCWLGDVPPLIEMANLNGSSVDLTEVSVFESSEWRFPEAEEIESRKLFRDKPVLILQDQGVIVGIRCGCFRVRIGEWFTPPGNLGQGELETASDLLADFNLDLSGGPDQFVITDHGDGEAIE